MNHRDLYRGAESPWSGAYVRWPSTHAFLEAIATLPGLSQVRVVALLVGRYPNIIQDDPLIAAFCTKHAAHIAYGMLSEHTSDADGLRD